MICEALNSKLSREKTISFFPYFRVRPAWVYSNGCKSLTHPDSGKCLANAKGVHRELESKGRLRQTSGLTYRNRI